MRFSKFVPLSIIAVTALCLASCKDYVGKESSHPFYKEAEIKKETKDYQAAIDAYKNFMKVCPESARVHYDIAIIYADNMQDYENAIAHFQTYLDMSRETISQNDRATIQGYIRTYRQKAFDQYRKANNIKLAKDLSYTEADVARWKAMEKGLLTKIQEYDKINKQLNTEKEELIKRLNKANETIRSASAKPAAGTASDKKVNTPATSATTSQKYYTVVKGDGLQSISKKVYGSARYASLIENANKDKLGARGILQIGQKLVIPAIPE